MLYFVNEALRGFLQAKLMTFISIVTVAVSLAVVGAAALCAANVQALYGRVSQRVGMTAYLQDGTGDTAAQRIIGQIRGVATVDSVRYVDKDEAWRRFSEQYGPGMLDAVDSNPLPPSVELSLPAGMRTGADAQRVAARVRGVAGVESVSYSQEWFARLEKVRRYIMAGAIAAGIACLVILYFVVSNTIKLTIYARRELIATMRVVGATDNYIRTPFILEGILQGVLGALIGAAALLLLESALRPYLLTGGPRFLLPGIVALGVVFGWLGSTGAVRKFLV